MRQLDLTFGPVLQTDPNPRLARLEPFVPLVVAQRSSLSLLDSLAGSLRQCRAFSTLSLFAQSPLLPTRSRSSLLSSGAARHSILLVNCLRETRRDLWSLLIRSTDGFLQKPQNPSGPDGFSSGFFLKPFCVVSSFDSTTLLRARARVGSLSAQLHSLFIRYVSLCFVLLRFTQLVRSLRCFTTSFSTILRCRMALHLAGEFCSKTRHSSVDSFLISR